ncbi:hypothetical protein PIB30_077051 [Stylosanthes scabra]|uniref:Uncharacterized protein n=1 Tax=Stylosanthes scabra TaxID=79078 RepID=A0ABU6XQV5_9FABA|nr:hypothetical protein [Stylosanthes scabra]
MGSGVIYYEYGNHEKFEDNDLKADAELGTFKIRKDFRSRISLFQTVASNAALLTEDVLVNPLSSFTFSYYRDEEEKEIGGMKPSIEKEEASEKEEEKEDPKEDPEEEENPEEEVPASTSLPMDIDATEDYL